MILPRLKRIRRREKISLSSLFFPEVHTERNSVDSVDSEVIEGAAHLAIISAFLIMAMNRMSRHAVRTSDFSSEFHLPPPILFFLRVG